MNHAEAANPTQIVVLGDSLTAGYLLPQDAAFPAQLESVLQKKGYAVTISNAGVSGDTASGGLARLDWSVPDGTDLVIVELGANDMLRGVDPKVTSEAIETIVANLKKRNIAVLLAGMLAAPNLGETYTKQFNALYPTIARKYGVPLYPFFLDGIAGDSRLNLSDGLHPTREGVTVIVTRILPMVEDLIRALPQKN